MIGVNEMIWTAICAKDGRSEAICFNALNDASDALKDIRTVVRGDGYRVLALLKGDQTGNFYSMILDSEDLVDSQQ